MADEIRINTRPAPQMQPSQPVQQETDQKSVKMPWLVIAIVVIILAVVGFMFRDKLFGKGKDAKAPGTNVATYQAVFLTNGQVYFGKLSNATSDYLTLNDIYYLQVGPQQGSGGTAGQSATTSQQSITLVKLGQELHGPVDEMHISRSQVLFYEDLKDDGQVVKAIIADKNSANK